MLLFFSHQNYKVFFITRQEEGQALDRQSTQQQPLEFDLLYIFVTVQDQ